LFLPIDTLLEDSLNRLRFAVEEVRFVEPVAPCCVETFLSRLPKRHIKGQPNVTLKEKFTKKHEDCGKWDYLFSNSLPPLRERIVWNVLRDIVR
jgi:hypothetical protein